MDWAILYDVSKDDPGLQSLLFPRVLASAFARWSSAPVEVAESFAWWLPRAATGGSTQLRRSFA